MYSQLSWKKFVRVKKYIRYRAYIYAGTSWLYTIPDKRRVCHHGEWREGKVILFFFRNITVELTQEYILNTALQRTRIYPWYYDISRSEFTLDDRYFEHLGIPAGEDNTLTMEEFVNMIHPDDQQAMADAFVIQLSGNTTFDKTVPFRLHRGDGTWEWFEGQSIISQIYPVIRIGW